MQVALQRRNYLQPIMKSASRQLGTWGDKDQQSRITNEKKKKNRQRERDEKEKYIKLVIADN